MRRRIVSIAAVVLAAVSCGPSAQDESLVVSAAASLTDAFVAVERAFEAATPGVDVVLNLGGSSALREQILEGARIDVFAAADRRTMQDVEAEGATADPPVVFARNAMTIAVPAGNPAAIRGIDDLADPDLFIGLCNAEVPCGALARGVLDNAGVVAAVDTEEPDVRALLTKIGAGELDAGIVYVTDLASADVDEIQIPAAVNVLTDYPIAVLADAPSPEFAVRFVDFVGSPEGRAILADHGFALP